MAEGKHISQGYIMKSILYSTDKMILHEIIALRNQVVNNFIEKVDIRINITQWSIVFVSVQFKRVKYTFRN